MTRDEATPLVIDITREFVALVREIDPQWRKAYLRFSLQGSSYGIKGSYANESTVEMISVMDYEDFFDLAMDKGVELMAALEKAQGVFLLVVDSDLHYEIKFEDEDMDRWGISKVGGGTGIPEGLD